MEEYFEKRLKGLIPFTGFMSMGLASQIGLFVLINVLQGNCITAVILFIAGFVATTISYLITVSGGVPLPGPKKREEESRVLLDSIKGGVPPPGPTAGVPLPAPKGGVPLPSPKLKQHIRITIFMAIMVVSEIGLFILVRSLGGPTFSSILYFVAGIAGSTISYAVTVSGGVPPPGPKGWEQTNKTGK